MASFWKSEGLGLHTKKPYQTYDWRGKGTEYIPFLKEPRDGNDAILINKEEKLKLSLAESGDEPLSTEVIIEVVICILAFVGRGLCLNSVGPTLIDLRQIAHFTVPQAAWIFVSQSTGFLIGSLLAKRVLQEFNNKLSLSLCLLSQAVFTTCIPAFSSAIIMCLMFVGQGVALGVVGIGVCATCIRIGGKKRNGMFLQAAYLGVSIGSVCGPFIARPFLSNLAHHEVNTYDEEQPRLVNTYLQEGYDNLTTVGLLEQFLRPTTPDPAPPLHLFTQTHVYIYYAIIGVILCVPAFAFFILYKRSGDPIRNLKVDDSQSESLALQDWTLPLFIAVAMIFIQCLLYFGIQDAYSNLLTTFAILGPLHFTKTQGVYLSSLFWASMCFGRLNGIWIAKLLGPFKLLMMDMTMGGIAAAVLLLFSNRYAEVLWGFTVVLGLSFATVNGATVSWAANHLPGNNYILAIIMVGRCTGLLLLPTTVTTLFQKTGPMSLMYALLLTVILMVTTLLISQLIAHKFGVDGKLHSKSEMKKLRSEKEGIYGF